MSRSFIPAICPKCGGELRVPENLKIFRCMYCGTEIIQAVDESPGINKQKEINNLSMLASEAEKNANYQESYKYFTLILESDSDNHRAWIGKGFSAGMLSTETHIRIFEAIDCLEKGFSIKQYKQKKEPIEQNLENKITEILSINEGLRKLSFAYHINLVKAAFDWMETIKPMSSPRGLSLDWEYERYALSIKNNVYLATIILSVRALSHFEEELLLEGQSREDVIQLARKAITAYAFYSQWEILRILGLGELSESKEARTQIKNNILEKIDSSSELVTDEFITQIIQKFMVGEIKSYDLLK